MIVEDSPEVNALLKDTIGRDPRLAVCATAFCAEDALKMLDQFAPDVIVMEVTLPGMDGLEATRRIMSDKPIPIVMIGTSAESAGQGHTVVEALRAGALTVLEKPVGPAHADYSKVAQRLCTQLAIMSQVKLVRRRATPEPAAQIWNGRDPPQTSEMYKAVGIACSAGGPSALAQLLGALGPDFPIPILLVQHMTASFLDGFASWLQSVSPFSVVIANDGDFPVRRTVHLAPAERHLRLDAGRIRLTSAAPVSFQRPSGTVLFQSMARSLGVGGLGVVLTGMGSDGAAGLLDMRRAGGYTISEDRSTATAYGMPAAAIEAGASCETLPLGVIGPRILQLTSARLEIH